MLIQIATRQFAPADATHYAVLDDLTPLDLDQGRYAAIRVDDFGGWQLFPTSALTVLSDAQAGASFLDQPGVPLFQDGAASGRGKIGRTARDELLLGLAFAGAGVEVAVALLGAPGAAYASVPRYRQTLEAHPDLRATGSNAAIQFELDASGSIIDIWARRNFRVGAARTDIYYPDPRDAWGGGADDVGTLAIDDSVTVSAVRVNGATLDASAYALEPSLNTPGWTNDRLRLLDPNGFWRGTVEVDRVPGWAAVPPAVVLCNIELAARRRLETPTAFGDTGPVSADMIVSNDTRALLWKYLGLYRRELAA